MNTVLGYNELKSFPGFKGTPFIISGPCSVETEYQYMETARQIKELCPQVSVLRAGIWKPRTRPNSFEGIGEVGLTWVKNASIEYGLPVAVEVATPEHVELSLLNDIDYLWIGARTTVSPFNVQALADSLKGSKIPVFVKNPVNPDLELWLGAIERLKNSGIEKIAVIHRGFSTYEKTIYRNPPMWELPIELRRRMPEIPIIVDPSHMGGSRDLIETLSQQSMDMGFDGLMIESHINPDAAWSDAKQQVTPEKLSEIITKLKVRTSSSISTEVPGIMELRSKIDRIDDYILELLAERMGISEEIGKVKKQNNLAFHQQERWSLIVKRALDKGESGGLTKDFILKLFQQIHNESIRHQSLP